MTHHPRSTATTPHQDAEAAQRQYRDHVTKVCRVPAGIRCYTCDELDAKAAGAWVRAEHHADSRKAVTV